MDLYVVLRRDGWQDTDELREAAGRSKAVADSQFPADISWVRSYVVPEESGRLGTVCIYQASSEQAIRDHAAAADLPITEIRRSISTVVMGPDPE